MQKNILPIGFYDLIFDEARKNHEKINMVLDYFMKSGFGLVKTPLIEFAQNVKSEENFSFLDVISGKSLELRSDITLQIERLVATKFKDAKLPLKLCYVGDVLLTKSDELYADRQSTQLGLEVIGCDEKSQFDVIAMVLKIMPEILDKKFVIEFSLPNFAAELFSELKIKQSADLISAVKNKNSSMIELFASSYGELISEIVLKNNDLNNLAQKIVDVTNSSKIRASLEKAIKINEFVQKNFPKAEIYFDIFGDDKNSYHEDIAFDVFCEGFSYPIVRGGQYKMNEINSFGATIYMNYLRKI